MNRWIVGVLSIVMSSVVWAGSDAVVQASTVTLHMKDAPLKTVVDSIGRSAGISVVGTDTLEGNVTARLQGVDGKAAIQMMGREKLFSVTERENTLVVDGRGMKEAKPYEIGVLTPQHIRPIALREALQTVLPDDRLRIMAETNQVLVIGTAREQGLAREMLETVDCIPKQVQLEVQVVAVEHAWIKESGVQWQWGPFTGHGKSPDDHGSIQFGRAPSGMPYQWNIQPTLSAKEDSSGAFVLAKPSIITMNGKEATILIGERVPVLVETTRNGENSTSVTYQDAGIRLAYTPHVTGDGYIDADLEAEVSSPALVPEMKAYRITTRQASTRVRLKDGDVFVIGGLLDHRNGKQFSKIPLLGDIPLLGKLFQHARKTKDQIELYILVKAHTL